MQFLPILIIFSANIEASISNYCMTCCYFLYLWLQYLACNVLSVVLHNFFKSCIFSTWWKFDLYFVYIFIADWNFLTKFCSSGPTFNENILTFLYLKSDTSAHVQLCDYSFIHTIYKFHSMMLAGNSHWGYLFINGVYS